MAESHLEFTKPAHVVGRYALYGRLAARIKHPNVVETLDILTMGQELLLVMEYIRGECFSKLLRAARRKNLEPSIRVVGHIASGMLHGLHAAHEAKDDRGEPLNVVHRDISPQNVMIDVDGGVKVLDFGVAKASARIQITRDGQMKGKLSYMSPEQLQGMPVDRRADVFACGVVLWEALTRRRLFVGEDASEVLRKILRDEVPRPSEFVPELTPEMDDVVLRALCKDPERRYQTAEELALDIENVIGLADPSDVTAWIYSVAGEVLTKRERLLEEIERLGAEGFPLPTADAAGGSVTDSDTFQRIQSWAEREAARAADLPSHPSLALDDDAAATVADTRVESGPLRPPLPLTPLPGAVQPGRAHTMLPPVPPAVPAWVQPAAAGAAGALSAGAGAAGEEGEALLDAEVEEEPTSRVSLPEAPVAGLAAVAAIAELPPAPVAVFSHAPRPQSETSVRRKRRLVTLLSAAGVFGLLTLVAVVAMKPVTLMSTSGALRPEAQGALRPEAQGLRAEAALAANKPSAVAAGPSVVPAAVKEESSAGLPPERVAPQRGAPSRVAAEGAAASAGAPERSTGSRAEPPIAQAALSGAASSSAALPSSADGARGTASQASAAAQEGSARGIDDAKERQLAASARRVAKQRTPPAPPPAPPRRTRTTSAAKAAPAAAPAAAAANNKLDCKQPFWIDEKGIRRLKMACL